MAGPIGWRDKDPVLLLNPRLPEAEREAYERAWQEEMARRHNKRLTSDLIGITTSGTSGDLKLVLLSRAAFLASAIAVNEHLDARAEDVWLKTLPDFHVGGLAIYARAFVNGSKVIDVTSGTERSWDARRFVEQIRAEAATLTAVVPAQVFSLVQEKVPIPASLRAMVVGGGALAPNLYLKARELGWPLLASYGLTECCSQVATTPLESLRRVKSEMPRLRLLNHIEARIGSDGRLEIKSAALLEGYIRIPSPLRKPGREMGFADPKANGWFKTEDRAHLHDDELTVYGRDSDFIKIGGESVDFARLNQKLEDLRESRRNLPELALLPMPDERLGHVVQLVCAANAPPSGVRELVLAFNESVLPFERIREIRYVAEIPRSSLGKVLRAELVSILQKKSQGS